MQHNLIKPGLIILLLILSLNTYGDKKPNIIYLMADDQNFSSVGVYGNPEVQTPNMDKLGNDGLIFDKHYNTTSICMASRGSVFTGMYEYKTGANFGHGDMKLETWRNNSYAVLLKKAGYLTAFAGKFGIQVEGFGYECGEFFDAWGGGPGQTNYETDKNNSMARYSKKYPHSTRSYGAFGQDFIKRAAAEKKPFCLSISFKAPHRPVTPDPEFDHIYKGKSFTKPANYGRAAGAHRPEQSKKGRQYPRFDSWEYSTNYDVVMAKYYQQIYAIDVALGMIRKEVENQGLADNTVIIYTSDNGFLCGVHGFGSKVLPFEESARVPMMIYDPRSQTAGKKLRCQSLTGNIDFAPTILNLAGLPIPKNMDGVSLLPLLSDPDLDIREQMAFMNVFGPAPTTGLTVLTKHWKYSYWWYEDETMKPAEELYHLLNDPLETTNLSSASPAQQELLSMRKRYKAELSKWKNESVTEKYKFYSVLFDPDIPTSKKKLNSKQ